MFFRGQRVYFDSCLCSKLGKAETFPLNDGTLISAAACRGSFCKKIPVSFRQKNPKFFETDSTFPFSHCVFLIWRPFSTFVFAGSFCLLLTCNDSVVIDQSWVFLCSKKISSSELLAKTFENTDFFTGQSYFVAVLWTNSVCMASPCSLGHGIWNVIRFKDLT